MHLLTSPPVQVLRRISRTLGLNRLAGALMNGLAYERRFSTAMLGAIRAGDIVWDVGANVGYYTQQFSDIVGESGKVYAFEPSHENFERLKAAAAGKSNVDVYNIGLSNKSGQVRFIQGDDEIGATSSIVEGDLDVGARVTQVEVNSGQQIIEQGLATQPNFIKVDVEGHELPVLQGLGQYLESTVLHHVFVEIHFAILDMNGTGDHPKQILTLLSKSGFELSWPDPSHIHAYRPV